MLTNLLKDAQLGPRVVPIVADEARTFGMANLFSRSASTRARGRPTEPEDIGSVLSYREATDGQILEEGISEAGAISSWTAAATATRLHGQAMLPFYSILLDVRFPAHWRPDLGRGRPALTRLPARRHRRPHHARWRGPAAPGTARACCWPRRCSIAAPTTPASRASSRSSSTRHAADDGAAGGRLLLRHSDERELCAALAAGGRGGRSHQGLYRYATHTPAAAKGRVRLLGAGTILREVIAAAELLASDWGIAAEVWSAPASPNSRAGA